MDGERDFTGTRMPEDQGRFTDDAAALAAFNEYMKAQDLRANPLLAEGSDWRGVQAPGAFLQFIKIPRSDLRGANLRNAELRRADLTESQLQGSDLGGVNLMVSNLQRADLSDCFMRGVDLYEAGLAGASFQRSDMSNAYFMRLNFKEADITDTTMFMAQFYRADLRGAIGLETVKDLGTARFHRLGVTDSELQIIQDAMRSGPMFDVSA
ncbi:MAG: pentapeptide repeat-containing protein, partial [Dehalococcoidia bacterium]